jgi:hypothetical protein
MQRGNAVVPIAGHFELGSESDEEVLTTERRDKLNSDGKPIIGPPKWKRDGWLAGDIELRGVLHD